MQNYDVIDNSAPSFGVEQFLRVTSSASTQRKRGASSPDEGPLRRKTPKTNCWKCHTCHADNADPLSFRCTSCGVLKLGHGGRMEKRDSITSTASSSLNSFSIDELVGNLQDLEFDLDAVEAYNSDHYSAAPSLNDSTTFNSAGNWSLRDLEKWSCRMCTFENEPLFCACEMCGQTKPSKAPPKEEEVPAIAIQQEERLSELLQYRMPDAAVASLESKLPALTIDIDSEVPSIKPPMKVKTARRPNGRSKSPVAPSLMNDRSMGDTSMGEFHATVNKARRTYNPEDSDATATTFNMSSSVQEDSWFLPDSSSYQPGITEEEIDGVEC